MAQRSAAKRRRDAEADDDGDGAKNDNNDDDNDNEDSRSVSETADEKRARLAMQYIQGVKRVLGTKRSKAGLSSSSGSDDDDDDRANERTAPPGTLKETNADVDADDAAVAARLDDDARVMANAHFRHVAQRTRLQPDGALWLKGLREPLTCVAASNQYVFAGCKAGHIMQWDAATGRRVHQYFGGRRKPVAGGTAAHRFSFASIFNEV